LTPTVTATFVDTVSALRVTERFTLTHKTFSINNKYKPGFLLFHTMTRNNSSSFAKIPRSLIRHYWNPILSELRDRIFKELETLDTT
jgi:hypothetical protein